MPQPSPFAEFANPNPDPIDRLTPKVTALLQDLKLARTIKAADVEAEAEWRLNLLLEKLGDLYAIRRRPA